MADDADRAQETLEQMQELRSRYAAPRRTLPRAHDWCEDCDAPIETARLKVVPDAVRCAECQFDYEKFQARYQSDERRA